MSSSNDKRTKGQILRLLDNALTQEELLSEKIKALEVELAACRKKAEDPRHELTDEAMSASKVSFRIDYYRTSEESPLKGIIEHLPSRQNKSFEGEGHVIINQFMSRFLNEEAGGSKTKITSVEEKKQPDPVPEEGEKKMAARRGPAFQKEEIITTGSQFLQRLRVELAAQNQQAQSGADSSASQPDDSQSIMPLPEKAATLQTVEQEEPMAPPPVLSYGSKIEAQASERRSRLLRRRG